MATRTEGNISYVTDYKMQRRIVVGGIKNKCWSFETAYITNPRCSTINLTLMHTKPFINMICDTYLHTTKDYEKIAYYMIQHKQLI
jgi:hypothetical protein